METSRRVLILGETQLLRRLATALRSFPRLYVEERQHIHESLILDQFQPEVIVVDGMQITPERFQEMLNGSSFSDVTVISIDPLTYQLTVLSTPRGARPLARVAKVIEVLSLALSRNT